MGRVLEVSEMALNTSMYGDSSEYMSDYLTYQMGQMSSSGMGVVNESLFNSLQNSYDYISDGIRQFQLMQELESTKLKTVEEYISEYNDFYSLQQANIPTQRYIMAHPTIRDLYIDGFCDGYGSTYTPMTMEGVGEEHYDYRRVMDGLLHHDEEEDESYYVRYIEDLEEGDRDLSIIEQANILQTWRTMDILLEKTDYDFTKDSDKPEYLFR